MDAKTKAEFFALYLGQQVEYSEMFGDKIVNNKLVTSGYAYINVDYKRKKNGCIGDTLSFKSNKTHKTDALNAKLLLKCISNLTAEDRKFCGLRGKNVIPDIDELSIKQIDCLRHKGYAIPFRDLSVDDMISLNWLKLI